MSLPGTRFFRELGRWSSPGRSPYSPHDLAFGLAMRVVGAMHRSKTGARTRAVRVNDLSSGAKWSTPSTDLCVRHSRQLSGSRQACTTVRQIPARQHKTWPSGEAWEPLKLWTTIPGAASRTKPNTPPRRSFAKGEQQWLHRAQSRWNRGRTVLFG